MSENKKHSSILDSNSEKLRREGGFSNTAGVRKIDGLSVKAKKRIYIAFILTVSVILAAFIIVRGVKNTNEYLVLQLPITEVDITNAADGVYEGSYTNAHMSATVEVGISEGLIVSVGVTGYTGIDPERAKTVTDGIIQYQMLNIPDDDIGTQYTDKIVQRAVQEALEASVEEVVIG